MTAPKELVEALAGQRSPAAEVLAVIPDGWAKVDGEWVRMATVCDYCGGDGYTIEPAMQCGDYPHSCGEGCAIPEQVRCRCQRPPSHPPTGDEEPF